MSAMELIWQDLVLRTDPEQPGHRDFKIVSAPDIARGTAVATRGGVERCHRGDPKPKLSAS
jgi:hypothetical protein